MESIEDAIERIATNDSQFIIICNPTTNSANERTYINGILLDEPNNPYMTHFIKMKYEILPTCILYCDYSGGMDFFTTLHVVHKVMNYPMQNIHVIFDRHIQSTDEPPEILFNQCQLLEYRLEFFNEIGNDERKEKYFGGEFIILGEKWEGNLQSFISEYGNRLTSI